MAIEYKVIPRSDPRDVSRKKYYASANITGNTTLKELCKEIEHMSTVNGADIHAVLYALTEIIPKHLANGKSISLGDLGTMRISIRSEGKEDERDVTHHAVKDSRIVFTASKEFSHILQTLKYKKIS